MAGVAPAILLAAVSLVIGSIAARLRKYPSREAASFNTKLRATGRASWALMMPVIIIGGIRFGLLTVTESAALAVLYALFVCFFVFRWVTLRQLPKLLFRPSRPTAVIFFLLAPPDP